MLTSTYMFCFPGSSYVWQSLELSTKSRTAVKTTLLCNIGSLCWMDSFSARQDLPLGWRYVLRIKKIVGVVSHYQCCCCSLAVDIPHWLATVNTELQYEWIRNIRYISSLRQHGVKNIIIGIFTFRRRSFPSLAALNTTFLNSITAVLGQTSHNLVTLTLSNTPDISSLSEIKSPVCPLL